MFYKIAPVIAVLVLLLVLAKESPKINIERSEPSNRTGAAPSQQSAVTLTKAQKEAHLIPASTQFDGLLVQERSQVNFNTLCRGLKDHGAYFLPMQIASQLTYKPAKQTRFYLPTALRECLRTGSVKFWAVSFHPEHFESMRYFMEIDTHIVSIKEVVKDLPKNIKSELHDIFGSRMGDFDISEITVSKSTVSNVKMTLNNFGPHPFAAKTVFVQKNMGAFDLTEVIEKNPALNSGFAVASRNRIFEDIAKPVQQETQFFAPLPIDMALVNAGFFAFVEQKREPNLSVGAKQVDFGYDMSSYPTVTTKNALSHRSQYQFVDTRARRVRAALGFQFAAGLKWDIPSSTEQIYREFKKSHNLEKFRDWAQTVLPEEPRGRKELLLFGYDSNDPIPYLIQEELKKHKITSRVLVEGFVGLMVQAYFFEDLIFVKSGLQLSSQKTRGWEGVFFGGGS